MSSRLSRRPAMALMAGGLALSRIGRVAAASELAFQASWVNDAEFTGYFVAIDQGYYRDQGLELDYLPGGPDVIPESALLADRADLTLTTPDTTIKAITEQGAPFKIIGAQYQKNPLGVVSLADKPINDPKELIGKTLAVPPVNVISVDAMLKLNGVPKDQVRIVPYAYDPTPLIEGEIDASVDFTTNVPFTIEQAGKKAHSFLLYDHGVTIYNDTVVVTEETLRTRRADLVAWLRASRKGWAENLADPTVWPPRFAESWFKGTGRSIENEIYFNTAQKSLIDTPAGIFALTEDGIAKNLEALAQIGIKGTPAMFDTTLLQEI